MADSVLVPVDFSKGSDAVVDFAGKLAKALGAKVYLVHVVAGEADFAELCGEVAHIRVPVVHPRSEAQHRLAAFQDRLGRAGVEASCIVAHGEPVSRILHEAGAVRAEFIVMASHGHGALHDLVAGSVCAGVLRKAACPVAVLPSRVIDPQPDRKNVNS